ncbi:hypothetical protein [Desulfogranum marinum]|uniref:hypothetical protein n=1 Tax=Desulfogranum marinum TaxID=453220 RepID=UPI0029C6603B|nr:hypothetical protein [Desulfogranum marinum]
MKNRRYTTLLASALLSFLLVSPHMATAGHGRQGGGDNSTLNIGITFLNPGWSSPKHRVVDRRVHYVRDRHGQPVVSHRVHVYEKQHKHGRHFLKANWCKQHHRHHRPHNYHRPHHYYW